MAGEDIFRIYIAVIASFGWWYIFSLIEKYICKKLNKRRGYKCYE